METLVVDQAHLEITILILKCNKKNLFLNINEEDMPSTTYSKFYMAEIKGLNNENLIKESWK